MVSETAAFERSTAKQEGDGQILCLLLWTVQIRSFHWQVKSHIHIKYQQFNSHTGKRVSHFYSPANLHLNISKY